MRQEPLQGMQGNETIYGPAVVGGDNVIFKKNEKVSAPTEAQKRAAAQVDQQIDLDIHVDGSVVNLYKVAKDEKQKVDNAAEQAAKEAKKNKQDDYDCDGDEECEKLKTEMKNGVLAYTDYMAKKEAKRLPK